MEKFEELSVFEKRVLIAKELNILVSDNVETEVVIIEEGYIERPKTIQASGMREDIDDEYMYLVNFNPFENGDDAMYVQESFLLSVYPSERSPAFWVANGLAKNNVERYHSDFKLEEAIANCAAKICLSDGLYVE